MSNWKKKSKNYSKNQVEESTF